MSSSSPSSEPSGPVRAPAGRLRRVGSIGPAALLVVSEAAWFSLAVDAFANGTAGPHRPRLDLPYLAFVLPALAAVVVTALGRGAPPGRRSSVLRWGRRFLVGAVVVVGAATSAGLIAGLSAPGATWAVAFHPWSLHLHGAIAGRAARWGWVVALILWGRGVWVGISPPSLRQCSTSLFLGAFVFLIVFAHQVGSSDAVRALRRASGASGWLLFVYFPVGVTAAAWAHERDMERRVLRRAAGTPSGAWLAVLTVPLALVALAAFAVGGAATAVGPAVARAARAIGAVLGALGDWIFSHLPQIPLPQGKPLKIKPPGTGRGHHLRAAHGHPSALGIAILCVLGLVALVVLAVVVRALVRWSRRHRSSVEIDEERESVFTWDHFGDQLRRALGALLARIGRLFRRAHPPPAPVGADAPDPFEGDPVRSAYRRVLSAARATERGRAPSETPREFAQRLGAAPGLERLDPRALGSLTAAYEGVRYADADPSAFASRAASDADVLAGALGAPPPGPGGEEG